MGALVTDTIPGESLGLEYVEYKAGLARGTLRAIFNAWVAASVIDRRGAVWVKASRLHTILRTKKEQARYLIGQVAKNDMVEMSHTDWTGRTKSLETWVRGTKVCQWVDQSIQRPSRPRTSHYLRYSEMLYRIVRDCPAAMSQRAEFLEEFEYTRRHLKRKRVKRLKLKTDELTGEPLERGAEFAHVRAVSMYFELADRDWNGVVVNPVTHKLITQANVLDEHCMVQICRKKKWHTGWRDEFVRELSVFEETGQAA